MLKFQNLSECRQILIKQARLLRPMMRDRDFEMMILIYVPMSDNRVFRRLTMIAQWKVYEFSFLFYVIEVGLLSSLARTLVNLLSYLLNYLNPFKKKISKYSLLCS